MACNVLIRFAILIINFRICKVNLFDQVKPRVFMSQILFFVQIKMIYKYTCIQNIQCYNDSVLFFIFQCRRTKRNQIREYDRHGYRILYGMPRHGAHGIRASQFDRTDPKNE